MYSGPVTHCRKNVVKSSAAFSNADDIHHFDPGVREYQTAPVDRLMKNGSSEMTPGQNHSPRPSVIAAPAIAPVWNCSRRPSQRRRP